MPLRQFLLLQKLLQHSQAWVRLRLAAAGTVVQILPALEAKALAVLPAKEFAVHAQDKCGGYDVVQVRAAVLEQEEPGVLLSVVVGELLGEDGVEGKLHGLYHVPGAAVAGPVEGGAYRAAHHVDAGCVADLSRSGEDNKEHYRIKIEAARLLMANTANTFTTPVFQGSTSVRDAAGLLIETVTKNERRKQPVDDASLEKLRSEACSLYQLNPSAPGWTARADAAADGAAISGGAEQGPLPLASRVLLETLAAVWVLIGLVYGYSALKRRRERH